METKSSDVNSQPTNTPPGATAIRLALAYIYLHFGLLKLYPDFSPAEVLADYTVQVMTFHMFDFYWAQKMVAILEIVIGLGLILNVWMRWVGALYFFHILATLSPLFLIPEFLFTMPPFGFQVEGQYVIKNVVLVAAGWTVFAQYYQPLFKAQFARFSRSPA